MSNPTIHYRFCYNSHGRDMSGVRARIIESYDHIPSIDGYRKGDKLTIAFEGGANISPDEHGCEILFRIFNAPDERPLEYAGPSMSIGDVVTFFPDTDHTVSFACSLVGFVPANIRGSKIEETPANWRR
jgi:hypothetical protein